MTLVSIVGKVMDLDQNGTPDVALKSLDVTYNTVQIVFFHINKT